MRGAGGWGWGWGGVVRVKVVVGGVEVRMGRLGFKVGLGARVGIHKQGR